MFLVPRGTALRGEKEKKSGNDEQRSEREKKRKLATWIATLRSTLEFPLIERAHYRQDKVFRDS